MKKYVATGLGGVVLIALAALSFSQARGPAGGNERGQYLVEEVARCWECHTPMKGQGQWDRSRWLQGAAIWFRPVEPLTDWAYRAPTIDGLANFSDEQARTILEKGVGPNGLVIQLPMHTYHLSAEDAQAVIGYLRSRGWRK